MDPFFTSNDSEVPLLEGVYIEERNPPAAIQGAFFGEIGVCGQAIRGPVDKPVRVTSPARLAEVFGPGGASSTSPTTSDLWRFFLNKPFGIVTCVRVAASAATKGTLTLSDAGPVAIVRVDASSPGSWSAGVTVQSTAPTDGVSGHFNLVITYGGQTRTLKNLDMTGATDNSLAVNGTDDANWVTLTKLASGTPVVSSAAPLSTGSDGSVADSDYTAANRGMNVLQGTKNLGACAVSNRSNSTLKAYAHTLAGTCTDRVWLIGPDNETVTASSAITDAATYLGTDRLVYCFNAPFTIDPATGAETVTPAVDWMASILSQIDVDIHPGEDSTKKMLQGITRLSFPALQRGDYKTLKAGGICGLEFDEGFSFVSGVTMNLTDGLQEITRRRSADYIQVSMGKGMKGFVKKKATATRRKLAVSTASAFQKELQAHERVVDADDPDLGKGFSVTDISTTGDRTANIMRLYSKTRLIGHINELVLETEIGTSVIIKESR